MSIARVSDPKAIGAGTVLGAFLLMCTHGLATAHSDMSGVFIALGAIALVMLTVVIAQVSV